MRVKPSYIQSILSMNVVLPVAISYFIIYVCTVHHCFPRPIKPAGTFINSLMCSNAGQECDIIHPGIHLCEYKKIAIYCPQGSGTLRQQLTFLPILHILHILHYLARFCTILQYLALPCTILHHLA